ncbi:hypothetical protein GQ600_23133 [Phytophthora cactorum]|nr:hypothetical protein GQ600_23133 [Phytophthora cactorum]
MDNSSVLVHAVCFQTACQKRLFKAFPEVALVDTTHGTNKNYYKLFSILIDDVFGSAKSYEMYRDDMLRSLAYNKKDPFSQYWKPTGRLARRTGSTITVIDELISTLVMLQEQSEQRYKKEFRSLGTRQTPIAQDAADPELLTLAEQLSAHAYRLGRDQYRFACSSDADYEVKVDGTKAKLRANGEEVSCILSILR